MVFPRENYHCSSKKLFSNFAPGSPGSNNIASFEVSVEEEFVARYILTLARNPRFDTVTRRH